MLHPSTYPGARISARLDPLTLHYEWYVWIEVARHELRDFEDDMGDRKIKLLRHTPRWLEYHVVLRDFDDALRFQERGAYFQ